MESCFVQSCSRGVLFLNIHPADRIMMQHWIGFRGLGWQGRSRTELNHLRFGRLRATTSTVVTADDRKGSFAVQVLGRIRFKLRLTTWAAKVIVGPFVIDPTGCVAFVHDHSAYRVL